jgi:trigger factor
MRRQGVDPDKLPWDYGKLIPELKPASEQAVKRALLMEAIAEREVINPAEDEVDIEIERFAQAAERPAPAVRRMMEKSGDLESLRGSLREKKTLDFLIQHAKVSANA